MNEDLLTRLADVHVPLNQPALAAVERRSRAIRRARRARRSTFIGAGAAVLVAGGLLWPTTTTPGGNVAVGVPLAFGALPAAASQDLNCSIGFGSWVSREHWAAAPEIVASASLVTASPLPLTGIGVHQDEANCTRSVPAAVFYSTDPVRGISVWPDVADPFAGVNDTTPQTVRGHAGQVRTFEGQSLQLSWVDADGTRWLALGSGVDQATVVSIVDELVFDGEQGRTLDPDSSPSGFVSAPVIEPSDSTTTRTWEVTYGDESLESGIPGTSIGLRATASPLESVEVSASMFSSGTEFTEVNGALAARTRMGPVGSETGWLTWQKDGVTYTVMSIGTLDDALALARSVEQVPVTDPRISAAPDYPGLAQD